MRRARKPGTVPPGRLGCYDANGCIRGTVGPKATAATVGRFTGRTDAELGEVDGRRAWVTPKKKGK